MSRLTLAFALAAAFLLGAAVGVTVAHVSAPAVVSQTAARPTAEPAPVEGDLRPGGRPVVSEPGLPVVAPASLAATAAPVAVPVGHRSEPVHPRPTTRPRSGPSGVASWFAAPEGTAAAGAALRAFLGHGWRGTLVRVSGPEGSVVVRLTDWMGDRRRLVDLNPSSFVAVCGRLALGLCRVEVAR